MKYDIQSIKMQCNLFKNKNVFINDCSLEENNNYVGND